MTTSVVITNVRARAGHRAWRTSALLAVCASVAACATVPANEQPDRQPDAAVTESLTITSPTNGSTVSGTITVSASASGNLTVTAVQFLLDGDNLGSEDTSSPFSTSLDSASISDGTHTLTARARDTAGNSTDSAPITINVSNGNHTPSTIPLSFNDPIFTNMTTSGDVTIPDGESLSNRSITGPTPSASITATGAATITKCRVDSQEAVRVGGSGLVRIDQSWLEAEGVAGDHADVIQAYAPGSTGTIHVTNSTLRAYNQDATAGLFVADNWTGTVRLENVVFWGGPFGLRLHSDVGGDLHVYLKDVYFVGPFGYDPYLISGQGGTAVIIHQWENVRNATIVNGALVPGAAIPPP